MATTLKEYHVVGRKAPTETNPAPQIYRMKVFAKNEVQAKSRFWLVFCFYKYLHSFAVSQRLPRKKSSLQLGLNVNSFAGTFCTR